MALLPTSILQTQHQAQIDHLWFWDSSDLFENAHLGPQNNLYFVLVFKQYKHQFLVQCSVVRSTVMLSGKQNWQHTELYVYVNKNGMKWMKIICTNLYMF